MTDADTLYLAIVLGGFVLFAGVLAYCSAKASHR
jgi:hypothetical protein